MFKALNCIRQCPYYTSLRSHGLPHHPFGEAAHGRDSNQHIYALQRALPFIDNTVRPVLLGGRAGRHGYRAGRDSGGRAAHPRRQQAAHLNDFEGEAAAFLAGAAALPPPPRGQDRTAFVVRQGGQSTHPRGRLLGAVLGDHHFGRLVQNQR